MQRGLLVAVLLSGMCATPMVAQKLLVWDVVSVKHSDPDTCSRGSGMRIAGDGISISCFHLLNLISSAHDGIEFSRIVGAPDWVKNGAQWDIDAKVAEADAAAYTRLTARDKGRMLAALLMDRFRLKTHIEQRQMPVYNLVIAKGGPKLKEATEKDVARGGMATFRGKIKVVGSPVSVLPGLLNDETGRPVVDKTGLTGNYDYTVVFVPTATAAADETGGPSIFTALEEQLGLKLEAAKEPMDVLVIDSVEQPTEN